MALMNVQNVDRLIISLILFLALAACGPLEKAPLDVKPTPTVTPAPELVQVPLGFAPPICTPKEVSIDKVTSFCANQASSLGGATFHYHPSLLLTINFVSGENVSCSYPANSNEVICSGPQNAIFEQTECTACRPEDAPDDTDAYTLASCSEWYVTDDNGFCVPENPDLHYDLCPPGSSYNNALQNCADDGTGNYFPVCPPDFPYYVPNRHYCLPHPFPQVFNCQTFTVQLGDCSVSPNNPGAGGGGQSCAPGSSWDAGQNCCANADHRCS